MRSSRRLSAAALMLCATATTAWLSAQSSAPQAYEPKVGQQGKDVVWVPTPQMLVDAMLDMAKVTRDDRLIDLGSGDGRTVITAARRGTHALGIEYNPDMVELSKRNAEVAGVSNLATFIKADIFESDFSQATVITLFLLPDLNLRLRPTLLDLRPGTRIVSNSFTMGEWQADQTVSVGDDCTSWCNALLWIVPAKVAGTWRSGTQTLTLRQQFQMITGSIGEASIAGGRLLGDAVSFTAGGAAYTGHVRGGSIEGTVTSRGVASPWTATRQ